ncbi:hypothetical protein E4U42_000066 [Claviceps africana]|uniref:Uncharacterized protein n=1 Tax=Claviceps africana TaxID=83212 RepID=A0A8K0J0Z5_9HYPO|nr:hypothetical protein E4U42_000066 [Claviceps africana]
MDSLKVPESGLLLSGPSGSDSDLPPQAFVLNLSDDVLSQMISRVRLGDNLELELGKTPTLHYGSHSHQISQPEHDVPVDLYLTKPYESLRRAERLPYAGSLFSKLKSPQIAPKKAPQTSKEDEAKKASQTNKEDETKKQPAVSSKSSTSSGLDSDIEALQNGLAAHDAARDRARVVAKLPIAGKGRNKLLSNNYASTSTSKSIPTSPAVNSVRSPTSAPQITATQQVMERKKEQRFTLVHELAIAAQTTEHLRAKWTGKEEDFKAALEKTAHYDGDSHTWTMKQPYWRELNVWKYNYATQEEREAAIDRAIRQYDKLRLSASESEWQLLLPKAERDKGKCLSRLQANIAKGPPQQAPKTKTQKPDDNPGSKDDANSPEGDKPRTGGESMSRSNSSTLPAKAKKPSAQEAQAKRLLSNAKSKASAPKTSPSKSKQPAASKNDKNDRRVLSAAIVENSDSSEGEAPVVKPKAGPTTSKDMSTVAKDALTTAAKDTVVVGTRPLAPREPVKKQQAVKRARDESDSSSSSGTPLSKRIKPKQPVPVPKPRTQTTKTKYPGQGQSARVSSSTYRSKNINNTSPTKSSPLASSPPTNASDLDEPTPPTSTKRKMEVESKSTSCKRRAVESVPADVLNKAHKFKTCYQKYEALHHEISALDNPPRDKLADLLDMRNRLEHMKKDIYKQCSPRRE